MESEFPYAENTSTPSATPEPAIQLDTGRVSLENEFQDQPSSSVLDEITETELPKSLCNSPPREISSIGENIALGSENDQVDAVTSPKKSSENSNMIAETLGLLSFPLINLLQRTSLLNKWK